MLFADGAGRVTIVDFVYTRCTSVCRVLGDGGRRLQAAIVSRRLERRVRLVTVSFDPGRDSIDALQRYAMLMHADPAVWTLLRLDEAGKLEDVLAAFGIVVVAAPFEQFEHNAAFHVLDANGRLARIVDADDALWSARGRVGHGAPSRAAPMIQRRLLVGAALALAGLALAPPCRTPGRTAHGNPHARADPVIVAGWCAAGGSGVASAPGRHAGTWAALRACSPHRWCWPSG